MTAEIVSGAAVIVFATTLALVLSWVKWSLRTAVKESITETVNGKIDSLTVTATDLKDSVQRVERWTEKHDRRHLHEQKQLIAALNRQGVDAPDGWVEGRNGD